MPKAYAYCRLSPRDVRVNCSKCKMEFRLPVKNTVEREFPCEYCEHPYVIPEGDPLSIQSQADVCRKLAKQKLPSDVDPKLNLVVDIDVSATIPIRNRENGSKMMRELRTGDWVFFPVLDRGFRNLGDWCNQAEFFIRHKINVVLGDFPDFNLNDPTTRLMLNMMAMFAEYDSLQKGKHTKRALDKNKAIGKPVNGCAPRGFNLMCTLCEHVYSYQEEKKGQACPGCKNPRNGNTTHIPDPNEQRVMWKILWHKSPHCPLDWDMIAAFLNEEGVRSRTGAKVTVPWCRKYYYDALELLMNAEHPKENGLVLEDRFRPAHMENLSIHQIPGLPKKVADELERRRHEHDS